MKVRSKWFPHFKYTLERVITDQLDGNEYGTGQLEAATTTANNTRDAFARLVVMLHDKGVLTDAEALSFAPGYEKDD